MRRSGEEHSPSREAEAPVRPVTGRGPDPWCDLAGELDRLATPDVAFVVLLVLSTAAAAYGLIVDSAVVVLTAMLLSPFPAHVFAIGLGLLARDGPLARRAAMSGIEMSLLVVAIGAAAGLTAGRPELGAYALGRTGLDVREAVVALAAGFATAFSLVRRRVDPALPGVVVAAVLVPSLATVGLCLSAGRLDQTGRALVHLAVNLVAVGAAAAATFEWLGRDPGFDPGRARGVARAPREQREPTTIRAGRSP